MLTKNDMNVIFGKQNAEALSIHMLNNNVLNLGPGKRYGIWVQGCLKRCTGCMAPKSQVIESRLDVGYKDLAERILASNVNGITISGGEPLLQWRTLGSVLRLLKAKKPHIDVLLYTGYSFEDDLFMFVDSKNESYNPEFAEFFNLLTWWIDGRYLIEYDDQKGLRGSSNQMLYGNILMDDSSCIQLCKQIDDKKWLVLGGAIKNDNTTDEAIIEAEEMSNFATQERLPRMDAKSGVVIGIPSKSYLDTFNMSCVE